MVSLKAFNHRSGVGDREAGGSAVSYRTAAERKRRTLSPPLSTQAEISSSASSISRSGSKRARRASIDEPAPPFPWEADMNEGFVSAEGDDSSEEENI